MNCQEIKNSLLSILDDYEEGERGPQRAMELITVLFNSLDESPSRLPSPLLQVWHALDAWQQGDRSDADVLATVSALARQ